MTAPAAPPSSPPDSPATSPLRRSLTVWQAVGLSVALMAPSMAVNINPQAAGSLVGRAVPLAFLLSAVGVLLVAYGFVRLCQYYRHAGSVYAFVGATLGPRTGVVAGWGLVGTYLAYGVTTSSVVGIFGTSFMKTAGWWAAPPDWAPFLIAGIVLVLCWLLTAVPARRGTNVLLAVEGATVALILAVSVTVLVKLLAGHAPGGQRFTLSVFHVPAGTQTSALFLGIVFGFLSFAGFEASSTLGEETRRPHRDIPRAIIGTAVFGGIFFTVVTAIEMMGFGAGPKGVAAFAGSSSLLGDLGSAYVGAWVGNAITLGATVSAFGCTLACTVGSSRLLFALSRDAFGDRGLGRASRGGTPARAGLLAAAAMGAVLLLCTQAFHARAEDTFIWFGTIGTLILLIAYALTTVGAIRLVFFQRRMHVPPWQIAIPLAALLLIGYTLYRNVIPYPAGGPPRWFPVVAGTWLLAAVLAVLASPALAERLGRRLAEAEGLTAGEGD